MTICEITLQENGLYKLTLIENIILWFQRKRIIGEDMTYEEVEDTKVPWCKFSYGEGVPFHLSPKRIF